MFQNQSKSLAFIMYASSEKQTTNVRKFNLRLLSFVSIWIFADYLIFIRYKWDIWQTAIWKRGNTRTFKVRSIVARFINLCGRKRRRARSLTRERAPSSITLPRIWKFHPRNALNAFTCPNFRWQSAVHVHRCAASVVNLLEYFCRSASLRVAARSTDALIVDFTQDIYFLRPACRPWSFPPEITVCLETVSHEHALGYI